MEGFDKIKDINLADLDTDHTLEDELNGVKKPTLEELSDQPDKEEAEGEKAEGEKAQEPEPYVRPEGRYFEIDTDVTGEELRNFLLGHQYHQPLTWIMYGLIIAITIYYTVRGGRGFMPIIVGVALLLYYPVTTIMRSKNIKKRNPSFQEIFHYRLDENQLHLQLGKDAVDVEWKYFKKMMVLKSAVVVYTGRNNGYIIPTRAMGDRQDEIMAFLKEKVYAGK